MCTDLVTTRFRMIIDAFTEEHEGSEVAHIHWAKASHSEPWVWAVSLTLHGIELVTKTKFLSGGWVGVEVRLIM